MILIGKKFSSDSCENNLEKFNVNLQLSIKFSCIIFILLIFFHKLNNKSPEVSVIIPTFNRGNLIENCIKSVLNQTLSNIEILIIDDGSIDNTKDLIKNIDDKRIKYIKLRKNHGAANARNVGIKNAKGKYISFQDSDDIFYFNKLEKQLKNLINKNSSLDFCKIKVFLNESYYYFIPQKSREKRIIKGNFFEELITYGNFISTQSIFAKKKIFEKYLFDPNIPRLQDYDLILRMARNIKISYTKEVLVELHIQNDSITKSNQKLRKGIFLLLNKEYDFNEVEQISFMKYLINLLNKTNHLFF